MSVLATPGCLIFNVPGYRFGLKIMNCVYRFEAWIVPTYMAAFVAPKPLSQKGKST
jgi:hypothetical protein